MSQPKNNVVTHGEINGEDDNMKKELYNLLKSLSDGTYVRHFMTILTVREKFAH